MTKILIVDDEPRFLRLLEANLRTEGYAVVSAPDGRQALEMLSADPVDLILLDVMMPGLDGFETCQRIRQFSNTPIIMVTAKAEVEERAKGLNLGADDYLVKPFAAVELMARVGAVLRRTQAFSDTGRSRFFHHGTLRIDFARAEIFRGKRQIFLPTVEYRLLLQFALNLGKVMSAEELLFNVWGRDYTTEREILWVNIARLRQKIEDDPRAPQHILTRPGAGYIMPTRSD